MFGCFSVAEMAGRYRASTKVDRYEESEMGKGLILWFLGVPGIIVIALLLFNVI